MKRKVRRRITRKRKVRVKEPVGEQSKWSKEEERGGKGVDWIPRGE